MLADQPSHTAHRVALRRAAHQLWDNPKVFDDPIALKIIPPDARAELAASRPSDSSPSRHLRAFMVARSRFAEDHLAEAVWRGVKQYVVLGAGLDTFAYRNPYPDLRVVGFFDPEALFHELQQMGFKHIEDLNGDEINARYFSERSDGLRVGGGLAHLMCARR